MGLMLARLMVMARLLDLSEFATYSASLLISSSFCMLACFGLQPLLQRDLPVIITRHREKIGGVLMMQCVITAIASSFIGIVFTGIDIIEVPALSSPLVIIALIHGLSQQLFLIATVDSRSRSKTLMYAQSYFYRAVVILIVGPIVYFTGGQAKYILLAEAITSLAFVIFLLKNTYRDIPLELGSAWLLAWRRFPNIKWRTAINLLFASTAGFLIINSDRWVAAVYLTQSSFAQYAFAWTLLMVAQSLQVVINASIYPILARNYADSDGAATFQIVKRLSLLLFIIGATSALPLWAILDYLILKWYPFYTDARKLLPMFLFISILRVSDFWSSYLLVVEREIVLLITMVLSAIFSSLCFWLYLESETVKLTISQVANLAVLLAASGYCIAMLAAWRHARTN
jgi:O-antigen/teichoic acid export membrane protein